MQSTRRATRSDSTSSKRKAAPSGSRAAPARARGHPTAAASPPVPPRSDRRAPRAAARRARREWRAPMPTNALRTSSMPRSWRANTSPNSTSSKCPLRKVDATSARALAALAAQLRHRLAELLGRVAGITFSCAGRGVQPIGEHAEEVPRRRIRPEATAARRRSVHRSPDPCRPLRRRQVRVPGRRSRRRRARASPDPQCPPTSVVPVVMPVHHPGHHQKAGPEQ